jgi:hypothetical protein
MTHGDPSCAALSAREQKQAVLVRSGDGSERIGISPEGHQSDPPVPQAE